jgi:hypothetical protein
MQAFRLPCFQEFWDRAGPNFLDPRFRALRISESQAACRPWERTHGRNGLRIQSVDATHWLKRSAGDDSSTRKETMGT